MYQAVLDSNPGTGISRYVHRAMSGTYRKLKDHDNALAHLNAAVSMGSYDADIFRHRGDVYGALNQWQKALDDYNTAIKIDPSSAASYAHRSKAYSMLGRSDLSTADFQKASELGYQPASRRNQ